MPSDLFSLELAGNEFITHAMGDMVMHSIETLRAKGLRVTEQRRAILEALARADSPKSAEETFSALPPDTCDLVTAYRCLEQFEKAGVVERGVRENGTKVYCLGHGHGHHHHLTCRKCGRTERIDLRSWKRQRPILVSPRFPTSWRFSDFVQVAPEVSWLIPFGEMRIFARWKK